MYWYEIKNIDTLSTPALLFYKERLIQNVETITDYMADVDLLRPHVKTHKSKEVCKLLISYGINKFKCATLREITLLIDAGAKDILMAYPLVGSDIRQFCKMVFENKHIQFSCIIDDVDSYRSLVSELSRLKIMVDLYVDVNIGMNRTGVEVKRLPSFIEELRDFNCPFTGFHIYDGHINDPDYKRRMLKCEEAFRPFGEILEKQNKKGLSYKVVAGGSLSFSFYKSIKDIECSPGTFVLWDKGYMDICPELPFVSAALIVGRLVSKPTEGIYCFDIGYKAISSENPLSKRLYLLFEGGIIETKVIGHSEEHLTIRLSDFSASLGDLFYFMPHHICPTVALYNEAVIVSDHQIIDCWHIYRERI